MDQEASSKQPYIINFNFDGAVIESMNFERPCKSTTRTREKEPAEHIACEALHTKVANKYWTRLQISGFVDDEQQLTPETTRKQAMLIAEAFAEKIGIKSKWKTFQQQWNINNLAQEKWELLEDGMIIPRQDEIARIFTN